METPLLEKTKLTFPFELRIDKVVKNARGKVALPAWNNPVEPEQSNNTAWIVLNGTDDGGDGSQGSSGGPSATPSPSPSASDGPAAGSAGTSGSGGDSASGGDSGGGLALTGAGGALLLGGSAVLALGLGAAIIVFVRRRSAV